MSFSSWRIPTRWNFLGSLLHVGGIAFIYVGRKVCFFRFRSWMVLLSLRFWCYLLGTSGVHFHPFSACFDWSDGLLVCVVRISIGACCWFQVFVFIDQHDTWSFLSWIPCFVLFVLVDVLFLLFLLLHRFFLWMVRSFLRCLLATSRQVSLLHVGPSVVVRHVHTCRMDACVVVRLDWCGTHPWNQLNQVFGRLRAPNTMGRGEREGSNTRLTMGWDGVLSVSSNGSIYLHLHHGTTTTLRPHVIPNDGTHPSIHMPYHSSTPTAMPSTSTSIPCHPCQSHPHFVSHVSCMLLHAIPEPPHGWG